MGRLAVVGVFVMAVGWVGFSVGASDGGFTDVPSSHVFAQEVEALAEAGITRGCNPPTNTRFCPDDRVTRGQMAAFLVRALGLTDSGPTFDDTGGHVFAGDISRLAQADITRGCNPPANTRFCPDDRVTRGQMAAFLARALDLGEGTARFSDTGSHVFADDISRLATAGITRGCNPPANTRFCPDDAVTRGQMAAFLHRALRSDGGDPGGGGGGGGGGDTGTPDRMVQVAAGNSHSCAVTESGAVHCWGLSSFGLGNQDVVRTHTPIQVEGPGGVGHLRDVVQVSASGNTSCAVTEGGAAYCWGHNGFGKLGNGTTEHSRVPVQVSGLTDVTQVVVGVNRTCATTASGAGYCWGQGYLGDGAGPSQSSVPVRVRNPQGTQNLADVVAVSPGEGATCALVESGAVFCWGSGISGQLGNGSTTNSNLPVPVRDPSGTGNLSGVVAVSNGMTHACALDQNGAVYCWGTGYLGDGSSVTSTIPVRVRNAQGTANLGEVVQISAGGDVPGRYTCAVTSGGAGYCWGHNGIFGKLGNGTSTHSNLPVRVRNPQGTGNLGDVTQIVTSPSAHTCAVTERGAFCWGPNLNGQGGNGSYDTATSQTSFLPVPVLPVYR